MRGLFVTFEGIDRSGKTTQAGMLVDALGDEALGVREPGGTEAGEKVREILKDPSVSLSPEAEAAAVAFRALRPLEDCASGRELVDRGFAEDVRIASEIDASDVVPRLVEGRFVPA